MRVPLSWLREWAEVPSDATPEDVHAALVAVGFEEEAVHGGVTGPLVVGRVLEFTPEPQKNGKTINWVQVEIAPGESRGIVCGAHNFTVGDLVVVSLPGAVLPGGFEIAARKTYGHVSDGMMASQRELGLGDEHDGILVLDPASGAAPGDDALPLLGLDDQAVEINVTPDRGYALSIRGVAREYAASTGVAFRDPIDAVTVHEANGFAVTLADDAPIRGRLGTGRFVTRVVRGIDAKRPTPTWLRSRLRLAGIRSISLAVDITNYVMLETGQPIHGYDLDLVKGGLTVRRAKAGERLTTLDGVDRELHVEDLLICDDRGPIGLAGVMGGRETELSLDTRDVLIEAAWFEPVSIARTARRHKLPSEASRRYERGVDPRVQEAAAQRVVDLLVELAGGVEDELGSAVGDAALPGSVILPVDAASALIGVAYAVDGQLAALEAIGARVAETTVDGGETASWIVTPPSWRKDLVTREDLVEEIARIIGFDRVPAVLPVAPPGGGLTRAQRLRRASSNALAASGSTEVLSLSFVSAAAIELTGDAAIKLANPLDGERPFLRTSLLPGLLETAHRNLSRGYNDFALFENGLVFLGEREIGTADVPPGAARPDDATLERLDRLPLQPRHLGGVLLGDRVSKQPATSAAPFGVADAIDAARRALLPLGILPTVRQAKLPWLHPGRAAEILLGDVVLGWAGELLPALALELDLPRVVAAYELDLDLAIAHARDGLETLTIESVPAATQDLSLVVSRAVPAGEVLEAVRQGAGTLLEHISLVDDYRGGGVAEDEKSLTFALRFRDQGRTLKAQEATDAKLAGAALAEQRFGASVRA